MITAWAGEFTGPEACAECHPTQFRLQSGTHHAKALGRIGDSPLAIILQGTSLQEKTGIRFEYRAARDGVVASMIKKSDHFDLLLEWVFGAGSKAYTPVGRIGDEFVEHRVSWYKQSGRLGLTPGHSAALPADAQSAAGVIESREAITRCFGCHATGVQDGPDLSGMRPGVTCERCHGPGSRHIAAAKSSMPLSNTILNAGHFSALGLVQVCAECHRSPNARFQSEMPELEDPVSVRFAPVGFLASRCFKNSKTFSCVTCHDPHQDPRPRQDPSYTKICIGCHAGAPQPASACKRARKTDCIACHMKTSSPMANLTFTDHRIRIYVD